MVCQGLESLTDTGITGILTYPTYCVYWFWGYIMAVIFIVIALGMYYRDRDRETKPDIISIMGVSALATIVISLAGTFVGFIQRDVFGTVLVIGLVFIVMWFIKR